MNITGNCLDILPTLEANSIQCCVTSPPYYGLRDYGTAKWEGGDSECSHKFATGGYKSTGLNCKRDENNWKAIDSKSGQTWQQYKDICPKCGAIRVDGQLGLEKSPEEYVAKMVEVFREVRRVLRRDGTLWLNLGDSYNGSGGAGGDYNKGGLKEGQPKYNGRNIPSLKPKDLVGIPWRVAFALQADGWYLRQDIIWAKPNPMPESVKDRCTKSHEYIFLLTKSARYYYDTDAVKEPLSSPPHAPGNNKLDASRNDHDQMQKVWGLDGTRNRRSVWTITTKPFKEAHFATFPPEIPEICIKAGSRPGDMILDPFSGAATTGLVAERLGREYIGIELNPDYVKMADKRVYDFGGVL